MTPLVSAHRGGTERHPAATYEAYADAVTTGAEYAELDIRRLRDGSLVVFHDAHVAAGGPALADLAYRELCVAAGYEVPRVADVLRIIGDGGLGAHLDLKEVGYEADVVDLAERFVGDRYVATTLEGVSVRAIADRYPRARAALSIGWGAGSRSPGAALGARGRQLFPESRLRACGANGIAVHQRPARLRLLAVARARGLDTWVWTVDGDAALRHFLADPRVTVVVTSRPRRAVGCGRRCMPADLEELLLAVALSPPRPRTSRRCSCWSTTRPPRSAPGRHDPAVTTARAWPIGGSWTGCSTSLRTGRPGSSTR